MPSQRFDDYIEQCRIHHATKKTFSGNGCLKYAKTIIDLARSVGATSGLDYGCGKGNQYAKLIEIDGKSATLEEHLGFPVMKFDPAVPQFAERKRLTPRDIVWCTDCLEHIPEEDIRWVANDLSSFAVKALFVTVATYPAKKRLPNGENAHITQKPAEWWAEQFLALGIRGGHAPGRDSARGEDGFIFKMVVENAP